MSLQADAVETYADFGTLPVDLLNNEGALSSYAIDLRVNAIESPFSPEACKLIGGNTPLSPMYRAVLLSMGIPYQYSRLGGPSRLIPQREPWQDTFKNVFEAASLNEEPNEASLETTNETPLSLVVNHHEVRAPLKSLVNKPDLQLGVAQAILGIKAQEGYLGQYIWFGDIPENSTTKALARSAHIAKNSLENYGNPPFTNIEDRDLQEKKLHIKLRPEDIPDATRRLIELWLKKTYRKNEQDSGDLERYKSAFAFKIALDNRVYPSDPNEIQEEAYSPRGLAPRIVVYGFEGGEDIEDLLGEIQTTLNNDPKYIKPDTEYPVRFHERILNTELIDLVSGSTLKERNTRTVFDDN